MLHRIQEEAPEKLPEALATVADYVAEQKVESKVAELNQKFEAYENKTSQTEQTLQFRQQFNAGLEQAKGNLGGVYAEVVEDFNRNQENSLLFRKLVDNPYLLGSPVEAVKAVGTDIQLCEAVKAVGTDIQLWKSVPKQDAPAQQSEPGGSAQTAVSGSASERGLSINEPKPEAPDEAEVLFNSIQGAHTPSLPWE
jgi:Sec-independent protein translocase protein TatA